MADVVSLIVNGRQFGGWKEIKITRSMKAIASGFSVSFTDRWTAGSQPWIIRPGDSCVLNIDAQTVIVGYVDSLNTSLSSGERTISVDGREKTCDLVDCSVDACEFLNLSLEQVARQLALTYGILVRNLSGVTRPIPTLAVSNGETVHQVLEKYARKEGVLLTSDGLGTLEIAKLGAISSAVVLEEGVNLLSATAAFDNRERFSEYIVRGGNSQLEEDVAIQTQPEGRAKDSGIRRTRLKILNAESAVSKDEADKRAQWELTTRQAAAWTVTAKVQGWRAAGSLWRPNSLVKVVAPSIGVNGKLLVTDVTFSQTLSGGTTTELSLSRKDAFIPEPEKADDSDLLAGLVAGEASSPSRLEKKLEALYGSQ